MDTKNKNHFDVIIIGSGIGGLTSASLLSQLFGKEVLILEQHFKVGGFTHTFKRNHFEWDVGIHYIGNLEEDSFPRKILNFLSGGKLRWNKMKEPFEEFIYPDIRFQVSGNKEQFLSDLTKIFPGEKHNLIQYFKDIESLVRGLFIHFTLKNIPALHTLPSPLTISKNSLITTKDYLNLRFNNSVLKSLLVSRWGDYGLPPSESAFIIHALIEDHYKNGGWYPDGGSSQIASSIIPSIEKNGGKILVSHRVKEILIKNDQAFGVKLEHIQGSKIKEEKEFFADIIISDAGIYNSFKKIINKKNLSLPVQNQIQHIIDTSDTLLKKATSSVCLYLGLNDNPLRKNIEPRNYWIYSSYDHDENFKKRNLILEGIVSGVYLSFPSSKNSNSHSHTAEIIAFVDYEIFSRWKDQRWKNRDSEYEKLKEKITENLIHFVDQNLPGFSQLIDYKELSTPLTNEFFTNHPRGIIYGIPCSPERFKLSYIKPYTPIKNFYLTGSDATTPGFIGAMMGGILTVMTIQGAKNPFSIIKMIQKINNQEFL